MRECCQTEKQEPTSWVQQRRQFRSYHTWSSYVQTTTELQHGTIQCNNTINIQVPGTLLHLEAEYSVSFALHVALIDVTAVGDGWYRTTGSPRAIQSSLDNTYQHNRQQKEAQTRHKKKQATPRHRAAQPLLLPPHADKRSYCKRGIPGNPSPYDMLRKTRSLRRSSLAGYRVRTARDERGSGGASRAAKTKRATRDFRPPRRPPEQQKKTQQKCAPRTRQAFCS